MKIVIPMSGLGERFIRANYNEPKPLIEVNNKPIIEHVVSMFPGNHEFIFICRDSHLKDTNMRAVLERTAPAGKIIEIEGHKFGPVYAVSKIFDHMADDEPVIVTYCDYFMTWNFHDFLLKIDKGKHDGGIPCYKGFHPHLLHEKNFYAGCRATDNDTLIEIKEKFSFTENKMDTAQSAGCYYFRNGRLVKKYFKEAMESKILVNGEYYVSMIYNLLVRDGLSTLVYTGINHFCQWGTPEDLEEYLYWSNIFSHLKHK